MCQSYQFERLAKVESRATLSDMETEQLDPRDALDAVARGRRAAAERLTTPWWYHPILGVLVGALVVAQAASTVVKIPVLVVFFVGLALLVRAYQQVTGVWVGGLRRGPAGRITIALASVYLAAVFVGLLAGGWWAVGAGVVVVPATIVLGRRFDVELRKELAG
jgi:hypothetical protein